MNENKILEGDKLIAVFDGWKIEDFWWIQPNGTKYNFQPKFAYYHSSWNALMPACYKFLHLKEFDRSTNQKYYAQRCSELQDAVASCEIFHIYNGLLGCIKWYNENKITLLRKPKRQSA